MEKREPSYTVDVNVNWYSHYGEQYGCDPVDCGPPGSSVHGIFRARGLEWGELNVSFLRLQEAWGYVLMVIK